METQLGSDFASFKIGQVQVQYSGDPGLIRDYILTGIAGDQIQTLYELVIDGTLGGQRNQWEYTFTASGAFTKREKIIGRSTDNLEF
ncbi:MAG: hypothetical protein MUE90_01930 [Thermoanaerobaculales bacterium]|nr:hypothetical protein [Thermoanaerobaculales bacterium]